MEMRIVMIGLDGADKTTILYKLKSGEIITSISTIGFNIEMIEHKNIKLNIWDIGADSKIRSLWNHYYQSCQCLIFVIDGHDRERIDEVREALQETLSKDELEGIPLLILANKQDLPNAMKAAEITDKLNLLLLSNRKWHIQATCTLDGVGLSEGFDWFTDQLKDIE